MMQSHQLTLWICHFCGQQKETKTEDQIFTGWQYGLELEVKGGGERERDLRHLLLRSLTNLATTKALDCGLLGA